MMVRYRSLAERVRSELQESEATLAAIERHWHRYAEASVDQDAYLNPVTFNLHSLYTGLERVFDLIAAELDGGALGGERWRAELLRQMTLDLPGARPPVISRPTAEQLDDYRRFRHVIRNIYTTNLDPSRVRALVATLPGLWSQVRQDLNAFVAYLDRIADSDAV
jgi:hypothetical protein